MLASLVTLNTYFAVFAKYTVDYSTNNTIRIEHLKESYDKLEKIQDDDWDKIYDLYNIVTKLWADGESLFVHFFPRNRNGWVVHSLEHCSLKIHDNTYTVRTSSTLSEDYLPSNLLIKYYGNSNAWVTKKHGSNHSWAIFEYPYKVDINFIRVKVRPNHPEQAPEKFEIRGSNSSNFDDGDFDVIEVFSGLVFEKKEIFSTQFDRSNSYQYYQVFFYNSKSEYLGISELNLGLELSSDIEFIYRLVLKKGLENIVE